MWTSLISHSFHYGTAVCVSVLMCHHWNYICMCICLKHVCLINICSGPEESLLPLTHLHTG